MIDNSFQNSLNLDSNLILQVLHSSCWLLTNHAVPFCNVQWRGLPTKPAPPAGVTFQIRSF